MLCLKKRRTYSFTQGVCADLPRRSKKDNHRYEGSLNMAITTLPRKNRSREERPSRMVLTVTEDTPADMLAGSMELLVHLPRDHHPQTQRVTVQRSTPMMDLLVQIATAHKLAASNYTLQAIGERGLVLPHQPNTPIGALDALQVKLLPKQGTFVPRKTKQANQPFETTFRLQVHLPRNQLYVSRVSPKMNLGEILDEVCREKNLDRNKYELRHPVNIEEILDLSLSLQDYHLQEVTLYARQGRTLGSALSSQDIMALQRQEERRRQQAKQGVFGFVFKKSKEGSLSTDSLGGRSASPARSDETGRSSSPIQPPARPQRKRRPAPKPPTQVPVNEENDEDSGKDKVVISHSRNSSDSSGYHESSVLSDNPDSAGRLPETLPRRSRAPGGLDAPRKLAHTSQSSKSLGNLATISGTLSHGISSTSLSSAGLRKKRAAPPPPTSRPLSSAISTQALERIVDSEESLTSDIDPSKPPSDIGAPSKASSDIGVSTKTSQSIDLKSTKDVPSSDRSFNGNVSSCVDVEARYRSGSTNQSVVEERASVETARVTTKRVGEPVPLPKPRTVSASSGSTPPKVPKRRLAPLSAPRRSLSLESSHVETLAGDPESSIDRTQRAASSAGEITRPREIEGAGAQNGRRPSDGKVNRDEKLKDEAIEVLEAFDEAINYSVSSDVSDSQTDGVKDSDGVTVPPKVEEVKEPSACVDKTDLKDANDNVIKLESVKIVEKSEPVLNETNIEIVAEQAKEETPRRKIEENRDNVKPSVDVVEVNRNSADPKISTKKSKPLCAVISTMPKCDHLGVLTEAKNPSTRFEKRNSSGKNDLAGEDLKDRDQDDETKIKATEAVECDREIVDESARSTKRGKIFRSMSKANDFETNSLERQKRHLTSHAEDITFALNLNLSSSVDFSKDPDCKRKDPPMVDQSADSVEENCSLGLDDGKLQHGLMGISDAEKGLSETDILLQKVSDTLSSTLPIAASNDVEHDVQQSTTVSNATTDRPSVTTPPKTSSLEEPKASTQESYEETLNVTLGSQQDTSDYVSAVDEDLSLTDWEYQLPAPPSAFRDTNSPAFDHYGTTVFHPIDDTKHHEDISHIARHSQTDVSKHREDPSHIARHSETDVSKHHVDPSHSPHDPETDIPTGVSSTRSKMENRSVDSRAKPNAKLGLRKEIINELENKLENKVDHVVQKEVPRKVVEKIAPVDNTLANFKITTYARQKSLNIFEEVDQSIRSGGPDERFMSSFPTLTRGKAQLEKRVDAVGENLDELDYRGSEPKTNEHLVERWKLEDGNKGKNDVQSVKQVCARENHVESESKAESQKLERINVNLKKSTSISGLNTALPRNNEKFSQWRENILKRQEEPTKEKQLQSLQVLKSILPQLKSAQHAEESVPKEQTGAVLTEKTRPEAAPIEHSIESNAPPAREARHVEPQKIETHKVETQPKKPESKSDPTKRYTYSGPPAISLGSWSERPSVNVQIKTDTDYKLGAKVTNGRTIVNINSSSDSERQDANAGKRGNDELTKKFISHTTATGFKKPALNHVTIVDTRLTKSTEKPIVTGVELKRTFVERNESRTSNDVDAKPVGLRESNVEPKRIFEKNETKNRINNTTADNRTINYRESANLESKKNFLEKSEVRNEDSGIDTRPINFKELTRVELKKVSQGSSKVNSKEPSDDSTKIENSIDTRPVNFKELTKAFGQEVCLRTKPKRLNPNRRSDITGMQPESTDRHIDFFTKQQNGHVEKIQTKSFVSNGQVSVNGTQSEVRPKRFTSVVGINTPSSVQNGHFPLRSNVSAAKSSPPMPVVKGFKIQGSTTNVKIGGTQNGVDACKNVSQPPKPPTMPVITGVTLKSASVRPKSMPVQTDPRDMLLESIRNFGGRGNLKNAVERC